MTDALEIETVIHSLQKYIIGQKHDEMDDNGSEQPPSYFLPIKDKDKLFWAFYVMLHGEDEYKYLKTKFVIEKQIKINAVETMHKMSNVFKQHKLNKVRIETELSSDAILTLEGFFGLCIIHNLSAVFIKKNSYCELYGVGNSEESYLVEEADSGVGIHVFKNKRLSKKNHSYRKVNIQYS